MCDVSLFLTNLINKPLSLSNFYWIPRFCACEYLYKRGAVHLKSLTLMGLLSEARVKISDLYSRSKNLHFAKFCNLHHAVWFCTCESLYSEALIGSEFQSPIMWHMCQATDLIMWKGQIPLGLKLVGFSEKYNFWQKFWGKYYWSLKPLLYVYSFSLVSD